MPFKTTEEKTTMNVNIISCDFDDNELFQSLHFKEYDKEYTNIGIDDLSPLGDCEDKEFIHQFLTLSKNKGEEDYDDKNILLVKSTDGILEKIYTPTIFKKTDPSDENLVDYVLKAGSNEFIIDFNYETDEFTMGQLVGKVLYKRYKKNDDESFTIPYIRFKINVSKSEKKDKNFVDWIFTVRILLNRDSDIDGETFQILLERGENVIQYLAECPGSSVTYVKFSQLGIGEFKVNQIEKTDHSQYGSGYLLYLDNGKVVRANAKLKNIFAKQLPIIDKMLKAGKPWTLAVLDVKFTSDGKEKANVGFFPRMPKLSGNQNTLRPNSNDIPGITEMEVIDVKPTEPRSSFDRESWMESFTQWTERIQLSDDDFTSICNHLFYDNGDVKNVEKLTDSQLVQYVQYISQNPDKNFSELEPAVF